MRVITNRHSCHDPEACASITLNVFELGFGLKDAMHLEDGTSGTPISPEPRNQLDTAS